MTASKELKVAVYSRNHKKLGTQQQQKKSTEFSCKTGKICSPLIDPLIAELLSFSNPGLKQQKQM